MKEEIVHTVDSTSLSSFGSS